VTVVDALTGEALERNRLGPGAIVAVCATSGGTVTTAARGDSKLRVWTSDWTLASSASHRGGISACDTDPSGRSIAAGSGGGGLAVYRAGEKAAAWRDGRAHHGSIDCVALSRSGNSLVSASGREGMLKAWHAATGKKLWSVQDKPPVVFAGSSMVATAASLYSAESGRVLVSFEGTGLVAADANGRYVVTGTEHGGAMIWHLQALLRR
jgi:WD40 repeat protein